MNPKAILAACVVLASASVAVHASDPHKHVDAKPKHGGMVKEVNDVTYELVAKPEMIAVYVEDHGKPLDLKGATGKVTLRAGNNRKEVALTPAGGNKLEAKGPFEFAPGSTVILQVKRGAKGEDSTRFQLK